MMNLEQRIEEYLLEAPGDGWVESKLLCARFGVSKRQLRKVGDAPGLCTACAISGNRGFKHIERATPGEWGDYYARERTHAMSSLVTLRQKRNRRHQVTKTTQRPVFTREKDTGQGLLFGVALTGTSETTGSVLVLARDVRIEECAGHFKTFPKGTGVSILEMHNMIRLPDGNLIQNREGKTEIVPNHPDQAER